MKKMRNRVGVTLAAVLVATSIMTGCNDKDSQAGKKAATTTEKKVDVLANWKPAEELKTIQGTLTVEGSKWVVKGDKVTVTSRTKTSEATLDLSNPFEVRVVKALAGGGTSADIYGFARNGDAIYIGSGTSGMKFGDLYMVGKNGVVVYDGKTCNHYAEKRFGDKGFEKPVEIKGGVTKKDGKEYFNFELPDRFNKGAFKKYSLEVVGTAILDDQSKGNLVKK